MTAPVSRTFRKLGCGFSARQYLEDGIAEYLKDLMQTEQVLDMVFVLPQFGQQTAGEDGNDFSAQSVGFDLYGQLETTIEEVEEQYSVIRDPAFRGTAGTGTGGYLSFLLGYLDRDGNLNEEPAYFRAVASHDGVFTEAEAGKGSGSLSNPYAGSWPDIYNALYGSVNTHYASECEWVKNYYTYIDSCSGSPLAAAPGGSDDLALLFRTDALDNHHSASSWDYSVFEYSSRTAEHYGSYLENLERSMNRFSLLFGLEPEAEEETEYVPAETVTEGPDRMIDLMGDWHFLAYKNFSAGASEDFDRIAFLLNETDWESWEEVQPALDWWTADFASSLGGNAWFAGYAWYVRSFSVPDSFDRSSLLLKAGMMDEGDEVYLNGVRIGATGIPQEGGSYDMTNPWDVERVYPLPDGLLQAGENTIAVRICNSSGGGGWYAGPVCICAAQEYSSEELKKLRVYETSMISDALGKREVFYRVYLPEGYYESERRYPTVYMLHGINSTGKSFVIDGVPELLDEGIAEGTIPPCIVIFPDDSHPYKMSWWKDIYADMLNKDLIRAVDLLGGVDFEVPMAMNYDDPTQNLHIHLQPGLQHLSGEQVMGLCRYRSGYASGDLGRIEMQQQFLRACLEQFTELGRVPNLMKVAEYLAGALDTDLTAANMAWYARQALLCREDLRFETLPTESAMVHNYSYAVVKLRDWLGMLNESLNPSDRESTASDLDVVYRGEQGYTGTQELRGSWYYSWTPPAPAPAAPVPVPVQTAAPTPGPQIITVVPGGTPTPAEAETPAVVVPEESPKPEDDWIAAVVVD